MAAKKPSFPWAFLFLFMVTWPSAGRAFQEVVRYVSPTEGSTDLRTCGSRQVPCKGLATIVSAGCVQDQISTYTTVVLLAGVHTVPVFSSAVVLKHCFNFTVRAETDEPGIVTIMADPMREIRPPNATFNRNEEYYNRDGDVCPLDDATTFFGISAFSFVNMRSVTLRNIDFQMSRFLIDTLIVVSNVSDFTFERCRFKGLPLNRRAVGIFNPAGLVRVINCTFQSYEPKIFQYEMSPGIILGDTGQSSLLYVLATRNPTPDTQKLVQVTGCTFYKECKNPLPEPTFWDWKDFQQSKFFTNR